MRTPTWWNSFTPAVLLGLAGVLAACEQEPRGLVCTPLAPGALVITEISRADWYWIEIANPGASSLDLTGIQFWYGGLDGNQVGEFWIRTHGYALGSGERAVLARFQEAEEHPPVWADYLYGDEDDKSFPAAGILEIHNCDDHTPLGEDNPDLVDRISWGELPASTGSLAFDDARTLSASANDDPDAWCEDRSLKIPGSGPFDQVLGSPGEVNPTCPTP